MVIFFFVVVVVVIVLNLIYPLFYLLAHFQEFKLKKKLPVVHRDAISCLARTNHGSQHVWAASWDGTISIWI
jgi:hypothetical protein